MLEPLFAATSLAPAAARSTIPIPSSTSAFRVQECLDAVDECGAPLVAIPGGEPLIHREIGEIVEGIVARKKFVSLCTNALLLEKKMHLFKPSPYLFFSVHLDGLKEDHDKSVCQARRLRHRGRGDQESEGEGLRGQRQHDGLRRPFGRRTSRPSSTSRAELGVGVSISPGYAYERAPDQEHFLDAQQDEGAVPRTSSPLARARSGASCIRPSSWTSSPAIGITTARRGACRRATCSAGRSPAISSAKDTRASFKELMETTDWDSYGTGRYEKCANCMAHCGYEPTAADVAMTRPRLAVWPQFGAYGRKARWRRRSRSTRRGPPQYVYSGSRGADAGAHWPQASVHRRKSPLLPLPDERGNAPPAPGRAQGMIALGPA